MYADRKLYYLKQMGIRPWVRKTLNSSIKKVGVLVSSSLSPAAQKLFQHMLNYLELDEQQLFIITVNEKIKVSEILQQNNLQKILIFGQHLADSCIKNNIQVWITACPLKLIQEPLGKKQVFYDLSQAKIALQHF